VVKKIKLTEKEIQIMVVLWNNKFAMTASEIVEATNNKTWKECSIWNIIKSLLKKGAVTPALNRRTQTNNARTYQAAITSDDYATIIIKSLIQAGVRFDATALLKRLLAPEEG